MRKVVRRIGVLSVGKVGGLIYGTLGLIFGAIFAGVSLLGGFAAMGRNEAAGALGMFFGVGAIVFLPIFYGILGALMGMLMAAIYNLVAGMIGGIELDVE